MTVTACSPAASVPDHPPSSEAVSFRCELSGDGAAIEHLHEEAFGPGRFARTAFRLREGVPHDPRLSLVAIGGDGVLVGSVRLTPIHVGEAPALLLGPLTVRPALKNRGIGKALMRRSMEAARQDGHRLVVLVGDLPYYWPFGFRTAAPGRILMPGPVDPARLLVAELVPGAAADAAGPARGG
jgi:predicted N-acetyltransferase YhbS